MTSFCAVDVSRHFRCGVVTVLVLVGVESNAEPPILRNLPPPVHSISPAIQRAVTEKLPKFVAPAPVKIAPEPVAEEAAYSADDVLHLPKLTIKERPYTPPDSFDLLTPQGRLDLALKTHPGLRIGNIWGMNNGIALAVQAEERAAATKAAIAESIRSITGNNGVERKRLTRLLKAASQRPNNDWATDPGR